MERADEAEDVEAAGPYRVIGCGVVFGVVLESTPMG